MVWLGVVSAISGPWANADPLLLSAPAGGVYAPAGGAACTCPRSRVEKVIRQHFPKNKFTQGNSIESENRHVGLAAKKFYPIFVTIVPPSFGAGATAQPRAVVFWHCLFMSMFFIQSCCAPVGSSLLGKPSLYVGK